MPFTNDLKAAGGRAALQPVPAATPLAEVQQRAAKHRTKRRTVQGCFAAAALAVVSVPIVLNVGSTTSIQTVAAGQATEQVAPAASNGTTGSSGGNGGSAGAAASQDDPDSTSEETVQKFQLGTQLDLSVKVLQGDRAESAAASAEASADETIDVDGETLWIARAGDRVTVSTLLEGDTFIEVQGPADQLDRLLEIARSGGFNHGDGSGFHFDGDFGEFEKFFGEDGEFEKFFGEDGQFPDFERFMDENGQFGDFGNFEEFFGEGGQFDQFFGENGEFDQFFGDDFQFPDFEEFLGEDGVRIFGDNFGGCISVDIDSDTDGDFAFEFPKGCQAADE